MGNNADYESSDEKVLGTEGHVTSATEYMQSDMKKTQPSSGVADWMAPSNSDTGNTSSQVNRPSVTKSVTVKTGRKLS